MPPGLSTSSRPPADFPVSAASSRSVGGLVSSTRRGGVLPLDVSEERLDARRARDCVVFLALDLRSDAQLQLARDTRPQVRCDALESLKRRRLLGITSEHAHINPGVAQIRGDISAGDGNETDDAGVLRRFGEEGRYLNADRFGDAIRPPRVTQMPRPPR